ASASASARLIEPEDDAAPSMPMRGASNARPTPSVRLAAIDNSAVISCVPGDTEFENVRVRRTSQKLRPGLGLGSILHALMTADSLISYNFFSTTALQTLHKVPFSRTAIRSKVPGAQVRQQSARPWYNAVPRAPTGHWVSCP